MKNPNVRQAVQAGRFYPSSASAIKKMLADFAIAQADKVNALACILPHAGYIYSGRVAVETVSKVIIKDKIILIGPNHTGLGQEFSLMSEGVWQTPLGEVKINGLIAKELLASSRYLKEDRLAHTHEHSLEVEIPILQYFRDNFEIIPIVVASSNLHALKEIGREIAEVIKKNSLLGSTLIIASSDMTHYEPQEEARKKDELAIKAILDLDEDKLAKNVKALNISMCGYAPAVIMLSAAKSLGARKAELIKYQTSGNVTGDFSSVVGYAGIVIS